MPFMSRTIITVRLDVALPRDDDNVLEPHDPEVVVESGGSAQILRFLRSAQEYHELAHLFDRDEELSGENETAATTHDRNEDIDESSKGEPSQSDLDRTQRERQERSEGHPAQYLTAKEFDMDEQIYHGTPAVSDNGRDYRRPISAITSRQRRQHPYARGKDIQIARDNRSRNGHCEAVYQEPMLREPAQCQRLTNHPLFQQMNASEAEQWLSDMRQGDVVIRPSSIGSGYITVTWKVWDGICQHLEILEVGHDLNCSVGIQYQVCASVYGDIDDVLEFYVQATARKVHELTLHERFQTGSKADTHWYLMKCSERNPRRSYYAFRISQTHPGFFYLCFKTNKSSEVSEWLVKVIPKGYLMCGLVYADMKTLCNAFKLMYARDLRLNPEQASL